MHRQNNVQSWDTHRFWFKSQSTTVILGLSRCGNRALSCSTTHFPTLGPGVLMANNSFSAAWQQHLDCALFQWQTFFSQLKPLWPRTVRLLLGVTGWEILTASFSIGESSPVVVSWTNATKPTTQSDCLGIANLRDDEYRWWRWCRCGFASPLICLYKCSSV